VVDDEPDDRPAHIRAEVDPSGGRRAEGPDHEAPTTRTRGDAARELPTDELEGEGPSTCADKGVAPEVRVDDREDNPGSTDKEGAFAHDVPADKGEDGALRRLREWHRGPSVTALRQELNADRDYQQRWDERDNEETRLPPDESVHLGGLVLSEAFTPSTVSALYRALDEFPSGPGDRAQDRRVALDRSRSGQRGGWQKFGPVRPPGAFLMGQGMHDADLPSGVQAVWLHLEYLLPSVAVVVATFSLTEDAGDLSQELRRDFRTSHENVVVRVYGPLGTVRAGIPWARPRLYGTSASIYRAEDQKRRACESHIRAIEKSCQAWMAARFPGRFAQESTADRPIIRLILTNEEKPYKHHHPWLRAASLSSSPYVWRSSEGNGWALSDDRWAQKAHPYLMTMAARRADVARAHSSTGGVDLDNWSIIYDVGSDQAPLAARHALSALLSVYAERLARLRDKAKAEQPLRRPVTEALALDDYLIRDGLDAAAVTTDVLPLTKDDMTFRWHVPEYIEDIDEHSLGRGAKPREYVPRLRRQVRRQAKQLAQDSAATTANVRASAELRQAISNTRLQRHVLVLAVIAIIVSVLGVVADKS
jgi:hypothetical protein